MGKHLTIGETAKRLGLEVDTVRKLERVGKLRAARTQGGHRRFTEEEIDRYRRAGLKGRKRPRAKRARRAASPRGGGRRVVLLEEDEVIGSVSAGGALGLDCDEEEGPFSVFDDTELGDEEPSWQRLPSPVAPRPPMPSSPPKALFKATSTADALEASRLQSIKAYGRSAVPWDIPTDWRGKVIAELERFVTPSQFPKDLSLNQAVDIVRARVVEVLRPLREAEAATRRARETKLESDRRRAMLVVHGNEYARRETSDWDWSARSDSRAEVERVLARDVQADWTELETENAVDDVLDEWDDEDEEEES